MPVSCLQGHTEVCDLGNVASAINAVRFQQHVASLCTLATLSGGWKLHQSSEEAWIPCCQHLAA